VEIVVVLATFLSASCFWLYAMDAVPFEWMWHVYWGGAGATSAATAMVTAIIVAIP
jgi:hypothetical protein